MKVSGLAVGLALAAAPMAVANDAVTHRAIGYICSAERPVAAAGERRLVMVPGIGSGGFPIATKNREAQAWFDYGMQLAHAFYHDDAKAAFKRAAELDPACAMCVWGQAWAAGPTINFDISAEETRAAGVLADKALALGAGESARNRGLLQALALRYGPDSAASDLAFAKAMDALSRTYPHDAEVAILTSDAWLIVASSHEDFQGVPRAVSVLEPILRQDPNNTGAIHFYIHATEFNDEPALALPYAERLGGLAPGASHLVHMASHTFFRVGRYEDAATSNAAAIASDGAYLRATGDARPQGQVPYHGHDLRFGLSGAMAAGDGPLALRLADHEAYAYPAAAHAPGAQSMGGWADVALGRFAPDRALALPDPGAAAPLTAEFRHYARGEALAAKGDSAGVLAEAAQISPTKEALDAAPAYVREATSAVLKIAQLTLKGRAAMLRGDHQGAIAAYQAAVQLQDKDLSDWRLSDPPQWWYPERRSLAAALLAAGEPARAAEQARKALVAWPEEPLTLQVLAKAEQAAGQAAAAKRDAAKAARAWRGPPIGLARL